MKVKNLIFKVYILIIPVLMCVLGCQDPILVGSDILDDEKINIEVVHNFDLSTKTVPGERLLTHRISSNRDRVAYDPRFYRLGEIKNDPLYGKVSAELFLKFRFNANANPSYHTDENVKFDSLVLVLAYDSLATYGNTSGAQEINVYQLDKEYNSNDTFYSDTKLEHQSFPALVSKVTLIKPKDSVSITSHITGKAVKQVPQLRLRLRDNFGESLIDNESAAKSDTAFRSFMKGVYITSKSTDNKPLLYGFNFNNASLDATSPVNKLILYYTSKDTIKKVYEFPIDRATINSYLHDRSGSQVETFITQPTLGDSLAFIHGIGGVKTSIKFNDLSSLKGKLINKAELEIYVADIPSPDGTFAAPSQLIATRLNEKGEYVFIEDILQTLLGASNFTPVFGGTLTKDSKGQKYVLNVTNHIKQSSNNASYLSEIFLSVITEAENPSRTALFGAKHSKFPVKLTVTYTKN
jgi:hypothetical protein